MESTLELVNRAATDQPDPQYMRRVLGAYPTGVVIVSAMSDGEPAGMAIGSFTSVSLDPPLIGFFPARTSSSWPTIERAGSFCVSVMAADQKALCNVFATSGADKFRDVRWTAAPSGSPIIEGCLAWIDCEIDSVCDAGDHHLVLGRVLDLAAQDDGSPLVFHRGSYGAVG